jgi:hypothetical protein
MEGTTLKRIELATVGWERCWGAVTWIPSNTYQCLGPIKNKGTHQGDAKLNPAKILEQTLIREVLSYSFSGSH